MAAQVEKLEFKKCYGSWGHWGDTLFKIGGKRRKRGVRSVTVSLQNLSRNRKKISRRGQSYWVKRVSTVQLSAWG